jgi:ankyrin repeat protein
MLTKSLQDISTRVHGDTQAIAAIINLPDDSAFTPLHHAIMSRTIEAVEILLAHGANVDSEGPSRQTPLHLASGCAIHCVQLLVENGASVNATDSLCMSFGYRE